MNEFETNQNSATQPIQINQPNIPITPKNNNFYKYLFFVTVVLLLGLVAGFYFVLNNKINKLNITETSTNSTPTINLSSTTTPTSQESTLTEYDSTHNLYTNNKFGFSLIIPKSALSSVECKKEADSYRPASGLVPVTFFENNETIYLAADNFYSLIGEQRASDGRTNYSGCEKGKTTFDLVEKKHIDISSLKIYVTNVKNDTEIENYFKSKYGSGCRLGEKIESDTPGVYGLEILSDGKDLETSQCPINGSIEAMYSPTRNKLVIFSLGQACNLSKSTSFGGACDDTKIVKSLKFL